MYSDECHYDEWRYAQCHGAYYKARGAVGLYYKTFYGRNLRIFIIS